MSEQPPINDDSTPPVDPEAKPKESESKTSRLRLPEGVSPEATVKIKVTPNQDLFVGEGARQATAPMRQPAVNIPPSHDVGGVDAHRTPTQLRRTAQFEEAGDNPNPEQPPTAQLKNQREPPAAKPEKDPDQTTKAKRPDDPDQTTKAKQDETRKVPAYDGSASSPDETNKIGMDTVALDNSLNTAIMDANCKTLVETGWRCPQCQGTNRHQGPGKNPQVYCDSCGHQTTLTAELIVPLDAQPSTGEELMSSNFVKGRSFLGKYMLDRFLGRGGMGEVWLGRHPNLDIPVAIKIMSPDLMARNPNYLERFLSEARTAAQMNHPNVVRIYDADHHDGMYFIVLEYMNGGDVLKWARDAGGKLVEKDALNIVIAVAEALEEAAKYNIIHRDIKPENIMLTKDGGIKLADLGIAKRIVANEEAEHFTFTAMVLGTPAYISPEQALNASEVDIRADIYSLGATFYQLVTGTIPFPAKSPFQMMYKHVKEPLVHPSERNPELAENIAAVICKMMEKDPLDRYPNTEALLTDLYRIRDRDASVMQLQASQVGFASSGGETHAKDSTWASFFGTDLVEESVPESQSIWKMAPVQIALGAAITALAVILGLQMAPDPGNAEDGMTKQLRNAILQVRRQRQASGLANGGEAGVVVQQPVTAVEDAAGANEPPAAVVPQVEVPPIVVDGNPATNDGAANLAKQAELVKLRQSQFAKRLQETEAALTKVREAGHDPGHGVGAALLKAEQHISDARVAAAGRSWDTATTHLDDATRLSLQAETLAADRERAAEAIVSVRAARRGAVAAGAGEVESVKTTWQTLEAEFKTLEKAMAAGTFRDVRLQGAELARRYGHLETQTPALIKLAAAAAEFGKAYDGIDRQLLETWAGEELAAVEKARRLAAAETIRHADAANGFRDARNLLATAIRLAGERRDAHEAATAAKAQQAAKEAAAAKADARWQRARDELDELFGRVTAAAKTPKTESIAVLTASELQLRLKEAKPLARDAADRTYLDDLKKQAEVLVSRLSAAPRFGHAWLIPALEVEMMPIAKGNYVRGSATGADDEGPPHRVTLANNFWMGKYEITQRQFRALTGNNPASLSGPSVLPVESITWEQAMSFCRVLNEREGKAGRLPTGYEYRLPTEAEWEYACRAGTTTKFSFGDNPSRMFEFGNYCDRSFRGNSTWRDDKHDDGHGKTAPVGSFQPNPWGLHDMHGNVAEWCLDRYDRYPKSEVTDPIGSGKREERVFRGGSWTGAASLCRSAQRSASSPTYAINSVGFRIVLAPSAILEEGGGISRLLSP